MNDITSFDCNLSSDRHESVLLDPPPVDWMKFNVDATVDANKGVVSYGVAVRNHNGLVMAEGIV